MLIFFINLSNNLYRFWWYIINKRNKVLKIFKEYGTTIKINKLNAIFYLQIKNPCTVTPWIYNIFLKLNRAKYSFGKNFLNYENSKEYFLFNHLGYIDFKRLQVYRNIRQYALNTLKSFNVINNPVMSNILQV